MLEFIRNRRRKELLESPFPGSWLEYLHANVRLYSQLTRAEQLSLQNDLRVFISEKYWEGCAGQSITDEVRVTISAHACLLTLHLEHDYYPNVESILVYPAGYIAPTKRAAPGGIIDEGKSARLGEAWSTGPIVISWQDALQDGQGHNPGHNVTIHEFAHKLDMASGGADGVPRLHLDADYNRWAAVMSAEYTNLHHRIEMGEPTVIDPYAATNAAEFFAVSTETFFEKPIYLAHHLPAMYQVMQAFYMQDPARRDLADYRKQD